MKNEDNAWSNETRSWDNETRNEDPKTRNEDNETEWKRKWYGSEFVEKTKNKRKMIRFKFASTN